MNTLIDIIPNYYENLSLVEKEIMLENLITMNMDAIYDGDRFEHDYDMNFIDLSYGRLNEEQRLIILREMLLIYKNSVKDKNR